MDEFADALQTEIEELKKKVAELTEFKKQIIVMMPCIKESNGRDCTGKVYFLRHSNRQHCDVCNTQYYIESDGDFYEGTAKFGCEMSFMDDE